jgi:hypothetical protein
MDEALVIAWDLFGTFHFPRDIIARDRNAIPRGTFKAFLDSVRLTAKGLQRVA